MLSVSELQDLCMPSDDTPAEAYLHSRGLQCKPSQLSAKLHWIPKQYMGESLNAAGYIAIANPGQVILEALTDTGTRLTPRWRRTYGKSQPTHLRTGLQAQDWHITEGYLDCLSVIESHSMQQADMQQYLFSSANGTANLAKLEVPDYIQHIFVHCDNDEPGQQAASDFKKRNAHRSGDIRIISYLEYGDPANHYYNTNTILETSWKTYKNI